MGAPLEHLSDGMRATATELSQTLGAPTLTRALEAIGQTLIEMRQAADPRVPLEVALLELLAERRRSERDRPEAVRGFIRSSELLACSLPFDVPAPTSNNLRGLVKRVRDKFADRGVEEVIESRARLGYRLAMTA